MRIKEMNTKEIISTYLIRKSWTSVWRIWMWVLGLKGFNTPGFATAVDVLQVKIKFRLIFFNVG